MKKRIFTAIIVFLLLVIMFTLPAAADIGPKPSVVIKFKGLEGESYFVTLLSERDHYGPWSSNKEYSPIYGSEEVWEKFSSYSDPDGYRFIGYFSDCSGGDTFSWTYYPPERFKILIYFPEYDRFVLSPGSYERYAFDSYYTVDARNIDLKSASLSSGELVVKRTYDYKWEALSLLCRIAATVCVELLVALPFGFKGRRQLVIIAATNLATQTVLNVLLNLVNYNLGPYAFVFSYVWMELAVFLIEGAVYARLLSRGKGGISKKRTWLYALAANCVSFAAGMIIAKWLPGIF